MGRKFRLWLVNCVVVHRRRHHRTATLTHFQNHRKYKMDTNDETVPLRYKYEIRYLIFGSKQQNTKTRTRGIPHTPCRHVFSTECPKHRGHR